MVRRNISTTRNTSARRNTLKLAGSAAKTSGQVIEKAAVGLARWATTDHSGIGNALNNMPSMGFFESLLYILVHLLIGLVCAVVLFCLTYLQIAYGIPLFISLMFG